MTVIDLDLKRARNILTTARWARDLHEQTTGHRRGEPSWMDCDTCFNLDGEVKLRAYLAARAEQFANREPKPLVSSRRLR